MQQLLRFLPPPQHVTTAHSGPRCRVQDPEFYVTVLYICVYIYIYIYI